MRSVGTGINPFLCQTKFRPPSSSIARESNKVSLCCNVINYRERSVGCDKKLVEWDWAPNHVPQLPPLEVEAAEGNARASCAGKNTHKTCVTPERLPWCLVHVENPDHSLTYLLTFICTRPTKWSEGRLFWFGGWHDIGCSKDQLLNASQQHCFLCGPCVCTTRVYAYAFENIFTLEW